MFRENNKNGVVYLTSSLFEETGTVIHGISTRAGGVSGGCYASMNFRFNCDDTRDNVLENFRRMSACLGVDYEKSVLSKQVHEDNTHIVEDSDIGNGIMFENKFTSADGLITDKPDVCLVTLYADCVPVLLYDRKNRIAASVHSGWRGTVKRISAKAVSAMRDKFNSDPSDIICAIGPSIRMHHFEVGEDVADIFRREFGDGVTLCRDGRFYADMQGAIAAQLTAVGVPAQNIDDCGICTYCESDKFFSHRKTNGRRGNFGAFIAIKR